MPSQSDRDPSLLFKIRNSLACVSCRSRHVKCDANKPRCLRCEADGRSCHYVQSRRGLKYKTSPASSSENEVLEEQLQSQVLNQEPEQLAPDSSYDNTRRYLDLYYTFFHPAHPYLLPRRRFDAHLRTNRSQIEHLLIVLEFIASAYAPEGQSEPLKQRAIDTLSHPDLPFTGFTVQALILLAISVHCCNGFDLARSFLDKGINIALEIGMQFNVYAVANGTGDSVLEESWRRTWWGLYVVDGVFEVIRRSPSFTLWSIQADVDLPCEEKDYDSEAIPAPPHSLFEYNDRDFAEDDVSFSSFTYLIDVVRIMGSVMAIVGDGGNFSESSVDDADGAMVNWELHLPEDKKDLLRSDGEKDEPLFHAHMAFNATKIYLHRQRSRLVHSPIENLGKCAPTPPLSEVPASQRKAYWLSTKKTMDGAGRALNLFTAPTICNKHTPLIVCAVALSILAELSACSYVLHGQEYDAARTRIRLGIGTLKEYGKAWPVGGQTLSEVKTIAREVFARKTCPIGGSPLDLESMDSAPVLDIQSYFDEFGAFDDFSFLQMPI